MRESFLHFIWQFQKFDTIELSTVEGKPLQIFTKGQYNTDAGPDFLNAKLLIDDITWYGHVELHLKSSDWNRHKHQYDSAYDNVVLHVVWEHDLEVSCKNGQVLSVLELQDRIAPELLLKCNQLVKSPEKIPCVSQFDQVRDIDKQAMIDYAGVARLKQKSESVLQRLEKNKGDWAETTFQLLAGNFGFKTNDHAFLKLAESVNHKTLLKHVTRPDEMEALIFGMAGFLVDREDGHAVLLGNEFDYLSKKYRLTDLCMVRAEWKYLRLRPGNFPTVRLAQFASFLSKNVKCFDRFLHFENQTELLELFDFEVSDYWKVHYDFGKKSSRIKRGIGRSSIDLILINTVAPLLAAYSQYTNDDQYMQKAIQLLQLVQPENNNIIRMWENLELKANDAFESQALIGLRNEFCLKKKCLSCKIGVSLINS
ncbi:MAG: DUF2851 family protein [Reichenbachiella sp.]|uniref:DUF2851 family protein n=1 Tax=Reichenbachiella sp. TaxID=2184521 RepID=UPI0032653744